MSEARSGAGQRPPLSRGSAVSLYRKDKRVSQLEFDQRTVERLNRLYATRDVLRRRELVRAALGARPGDRILDVGCGPGFYVTELLEAVGHDAAVLDELIAAAGNVRVTLPAGGTRRHATAGRCRRCPPAGFGPL